MVVTEILRDLMTILRIPKNTIRPAIPTFEGAEMENVRRFLLAVEEICQRECVPYNHWGRFAADQLSGQPYSWFVNYSHFD